MKHPVTLIVRHPVTYKEERQYAYHVVLKEFLGLDYRSIAEDRRDTLITTGGEEAWRLIVSEILFQTPNEMWLSNASLPTQPLEHWEVSGDIPEAHTISSAIEVIYGAKPDGKHFYLQDDNGITLGLDVFGSIFFMLTRYEEIVKKERDQHGRFPAAASLAYQEGFLEKPIVNEYLEILWACLKRLWPRLTRKAKSYQLLLTHDVDRVSAVMNEPWATIIRGSAGDFWKRKDGRLALNRLKVGLARRFGDYRGDPFNTFDFIMDVSEQRGIQSHFYFMSVKERHGLDGKYDIENAFVQEIMKSIYRRGHRIGFHGSYNSYRNVRRLASEVEGLAKALDALGVEYVQWGGRQHYLRWENPTTWQIWEEAGLEYDSTLGFADHVGFRCGTCYEYPVFNLRERRALKLRERPLIVMDGTLLDDQYMHLTEGESLQIVSRLSTACKLFQGDFVLLWHNSNLESGRKKELYTTLLSEVI